MDWLKDKKNQPIIAVIASVVIVVAVVFAFKMMSGGSAPAPSAGAPGGIPGAPGGMPGPGGPGGMAPSGGPMPSGSPMPGGPGASPSAPSAAAPGGAASLSPGAAPGAAASAGARPGGKNAVVAVSPMETARPDPFLPVGYKPPVRHHITAPVTDLPLGHLFAPPPIKRIDPIRNEPAQPARRMAGLLLNDRVYAMIETNGKTEIVQPGQTLEDGLASVVRIEKDKVILKTKSKPSRYLTVRMAAAPVQETAAVDQTPAGPASPYGPGRPMMGPMGPMGPMPGGGGRTPGGRGRRTRTGASPM